MESAFLRHEEVFSDGGVLFRIAVEPELRAVGEYASVALRRETDPVPDRERTRMPAVVSGDLFHRTQGGAARSCQPDETAVLLVPDNVSGTYLVSDVQDVALGEELSLAPVFFSDGKAVARSFHLVERTAGAAQCE